LVKALMDTLGRSKPVSQPTRHHRSTFSLLLFSSTATEIPDLPVEHDILDKLKARVAVARKIDLAQHKVKKENHERNWLKETAEAMEIEWYVSNEISFRSLLLSRDTTGRTMTIDDRTKRPTTEA
jgi:hypothetical protein